MAKSRSSHKTGKPPKSPKPKKSPTKRMASLIESILRDLESVDQGIQEMTVLTLSGVVVPPGTLDKIVGRIALINTNSGPLKDVVVPEPPPEEVPPVAS